MHELTEKLRPHVAALQSEARAGSRLASQVIALYELWRTVPADRAAMALCNCAFEDWQKDKRASDADNFFKRKPRA